MSARPPRMRFCSRLLDPEDACRCSPHARWKRRDPPGTSPERNRQKEPSNSFKFSKAARSRGVRPFLSECSVEAPLSTKQRTTDRCPFRQAQLRAVRPSLSTRSSAAPNTEQKHKKSGHHERRAALFINQIEISSMRHQQIHHLQHTHQSRSQFHLRHTESLRGNGSDNITAAAPLCGSPETQQSPEPTAAYRPPASPVRPPHTALSREESTAHVNNILGITAVNLRTLRVLLVPLGQLQEIRHNLKENRTLFHVFLMIQPHSPARLFHIFVSHTFDQKVLQQVISHLGVTHASSCYESLLDGDALVEASLQPPPSSVLDPGGRRALVLEPGFRNKSRYDPHVPCSGGVAQWSDSALRWSVHTGAELQQQVYHVRRAQVSMNTQHRSIAQNLCMMIHIRPTQHQQPGHLREKEKPGVTEELGLLSLLPPDEPLSERGMNEHARPVPSLHQKHRQVLHPLLEVVPVQRTSYRPRIDGLVPALDQVKGELQIKERALTEGFEVSTELPEAAVVHPSIERDVVLDLWAAVDAVEDKPLQIIIDGLVLLQGIQGDLLEWQGLSNLLKGRRRGEVLKFVFEVKQELQNNINKLVDESVIGFKSCHISCLCASIDHPLTDPALIPSLHPSIHPTNHLSVHPSIHPTNHLSVHPSIHPTNHLSVHPSIQPTNQPTIYLFIHPSNQPSICPSIHPSNQPSICSSIHPTNHLSVHPSNHPTSHLPVHPSNHATNHLPVHPSIHPSIQPTIYLSIHPTSHSIYPSIHPSITCSDVLTVTTSLSQTGKLLMVLQRKETMAIDEDDEIFLWRDLPL
ncbi:hypothetical protein DNTS_017682 [Danionella cerebrum]|uniref:Uncharacterized protein n=1 Tax=Danionella cerebrum TaxID=2873325 RepID=A0A553RKR6_9TELE|nr:hypothetical protein DNTS_017682 [Danionella translucida]